MARRHNGEGTIYPYRNGYAAQVWVTTPRGRRERKTVYGKTREVVHDKWVQLQEQARRGPVTTKVPRLEEFAVGWLRDVVSPNLAPTTAANYELFTRLYIDNTMVGEGYGGALSYSWNTALWSTGAHTITFNAADARNNWVGKNVTVTVVR